MPKGSCSLDMERISVNYLKGNLSCKSDSSKDLDGVKRLVQLDELDFGVGDAECSFAAR